MSDPDEPNAQQTERFYPKELRESESEAIRTRRAKAAPTAKDEIGKNSFLAIAVNRKKSRASEVLGDGVGLAISGGGIRSATFALGVLQAMAGHRFLRLVDFLSTVSGGSYIGAFLGRHYTRPVNYSNGEKTTSGNQHGTQGSAPREVEDTISKSSSPSVYWLRQNGRYLTPRGGGDVLVSITVAIRDWLSIQVFIGVFMLSILLFAQAARILFEHLCAGKGLTGIGETTLFLRPISERYVFDSVWYINAVHIFGVVLTLVLCAFLVYIVLYWSMFLGLYLWFTIFKTGEQKQAARRASGRRFLSECGSIIMAIGAFLAVYRLVDLAALEIYVSQGDILGQVLAGIGAAISAVLAIATRLSWVATLVPAAGSRKRASAFLMPTLTVAGLILFMVYLIALGALVYSLTNVDTNSEVSVSLSGKWVFLWLFIFVAITIVWSWPKRFLNLTTINALYTARIVRAYLGASNPERQSAVGKGVTEPMEGDDLPLSKYEPHKAGGPFHIINATLNETVSGESQLEFRDRKGLPVAVSCAGMSVGVSHHAEIVACQNPDVLRIGLVPRRAPNATASTFEIFPCGAGKNAEGLTLGQWVGISGAAVSSGMGHYTSLGLSMVLAFFNVRLGYWWNSDIAPNARTFYTPPTKPGLVTGGLGKLFSRAFCTQSYFLSELFGRFHGPGRKLWYLTDGGHFENTGMYELIRRQLPFIVCLDNGGDPDFRFSDLANMARRARTDFGAEIWFLPIGKFAKGGPGMTGNIPGWLRHQPELVAALDDLVTRGNGFFGRIEDLARPRREEPSQCHAAIGAIRYAGGERIGTLIWVKPTLTGDEPHDVLQYHKENHEFPHESTADQFFDEAQWESYRALGRHIGEQLMYLLAKTHKKGTTLSALLQAGR